MDERPLAPALTISLAILILSGCRLRGQDIHGFRPEALKGLDLPIEFVWRRKLQQPIEPMGGVGEYACQGVVGGSDLMSGILGKNVNLELSFPGSADMTRLQHRKVVVIVKAQFPVDCPIYVG